MNGQEISRFIEEIKATYATTGPRVFYMHPDMMALLKQAGTNTRVYTSPLEGLKLWVEGTILDTYRTDPTMLPGAIRMEWNDGDQDLILAWFYAGGQWERTDHVMSGTAVYGLV